MTDLVDLDWENLGFDYMELPYRYRAHYTDGQWHKAGLTEDATIAINEGSPVFHYGQAAFEGLKAYRCKDGSINLFRPDQNAARLQRSCQRLLMPEVPTEMFIDALKQVVKANEAYVPPYGSGGTLYLRPNIIGVGPNIGVHPASEYIFTVFVFLHVHVKVKCLPTPDIIGSVIHHSSNRTHTTRYDTHRSLHIQFNRHQPIVCRTTSGPRRYRIIIRTSTQQAHHQS